MFFMTRLFFYIYTIFTKSRFIFKYTYAHKKVTFCDTLVSAFGCTIVQSSFSVDIFPEIIEKAFSWLQQCCVVHNIWYVDSTCICFKSSKSVHYLCIARINFLSIPVCRLCKLPLFGLSKQNSLASPLLL